MKKSLLALLCALPLAAFGCGDDGGDTPTDGGTAMNDDGGTTPTPDGGSTTPTDSGTEYACDYPTGPYGTARNRFFEPFSLQQCDGSDWNFVNDGFCDSQITVVSIAAEWCGPCIEESRQFEAEINERYAGQGVRLVQIITQNERFGPPTLEGCTAWKARFGLSNPVLIDPAQITSIYFPDGVLPSTVIVDREGRIRVRENGADMGLVTLRREIDALLAED